MTRNMEIARTILEQLGGNKFKTMTGANGFLAVDNGLAFAFKGSRKCNKCRIILEVNDTYTMEFGKIKGVSYVPVEKLQDVYCDQLQPIFTRVTGLDTHL